MEPMHKGLLLGVLAGAVLALLTHQLPWLAAGVFLGVWIGHTAGRRRQRKRKTRHQARNGAPARRAVPRPEETPEHRDERLRWAATFRGTRLLEGRTDRGGALEEIRNTVLGFPFERYESELDEALARIDQYRVGVRARRAKLVGEAREMDALNAVFTLWYFNGRFSGHVGECALGPIDPVKALGDLHPPEVLEEVAVRSAALIDEGVSMGIGSWDHEPNMAHLRQSHPGFSDRALADALDWGHLIYR